MEIEERCLCGGKATFYRKDRGIPILQCEKCGDTFEADDSTWGVLENGKKNRN